MLNWVKISKDTLRGNVEKLRQRVGEKCKIMAVVKANAYGHGLVETSKIFIDGGADQLAVATAEEALELRRADVNVPILVLGYVEEKDWVGLINQNVRMSVYNLEIAEKLAMTAIGIGKSVLVDVKIDTGMNRLGFYNDEVGTVAKKLVNMKGLQIEGVYSHFANEDSKEYTQMQIDLMEEALAIWKKAGLRLPIVHMNKSKTVLERPEANFDMVRVGGLLYGLIKGQSDYITAIKYMARVAHVKQVDKDEYIGYRGAYKTDRKTMVAVVTAGYADGYGRAMSNRGRVNVKGGICNVIGQICMNQTLVDVTGVDGLGVGDEVVMFGDDQVSVFEVAEAMGTIAYEITSRIPPNIVRRYE